MKELCGRVAKDRKEAIRKDIGQIIVIEGRWGEF